MRHQSLSHQLCAPLSWPVPPASPATLHSHPGHRGPAYPQHMSPYSSFFLTPPKSPLHLWSGLGALGTCLTGVLQCPGGVGGAGPLASTDHNPLLGAGAPWCGPTIEGHPENNGDPSIAVDPLSRMKNPACSGKYWAGQRCVAMAGCNFSRRWS